MKHKIFYSFTALLFALFALFGCSDGEKIYTASFESFDFFGTYCCVKIFEKNPTQARKDEMADALEDVRSLLDEIDGALSASDKNSDISRFNAARPGERLEISALTYSALEECRKLFEASDGLFDPTAAASVDLWGFSSRFYNGEEVGMPYDREEGVLPDARYVEAFKELTDFSLLEYGENFLVKPLKTVDVDGTEYGVMLDLGAVGKGFAADRVRDLLLEKGENYASINIGQSSLVFLDSPFDGGFSVEISHPRNQSERALVISGLENVSLGVSGDYQRFYEIDGKRYCHIIDTRTGRPVDGGVMSAVTVCGSGAAADALSTVFMAEKASDALKLAMKTELKQVGLDGFAVMTRQAGKYIAAGNAAFEVKGDFVRAEFADGGLKIAAADYAGLITGISLLVAAAALVVALDLRNRRAKKAASDKEKAGSSDYAPQGGAALRQISKTTVKTRGRTELIKSQKLFCKRDLLVFGALALIIVLLFGFVIFGQPRGELFAVEIYFDGEQIFSYDVKSGEYACKNGFSGISAEKNGDVLALTVTTEKGVNFIEIKSDGETRVVDSDCRGGQCRGLSVRRAGDVVLCVPHALKISGVGNGSQSDGEVV